MRRSEPRNKSDSSRRCGMANRLTRQRFCTSFFSWHDVLSKGPYAYFAVGFALVLLLPAVGFGFASLFAGFQFFCTAGCPGFGDRESGPWLESSGQPGVI